MPHQLTPLESESLKDQCVDRLEELIITGVFAIGDRLPAERDLAKQLGISRPVLHEALVDLAAKGLVTQTPRLGSVVNDFRQDGTINLLTTLLRHGASSEHTILVSDLLDVRMIFEVHAAELAAINRTPGQLARLEAILSEQNGQHSWSPRTLAEYDFRFHHTLMLATGNMIYPLLVNSFKQFYIDLAVKFYSNPIDSFVHGLHVQLVSAISGQDPIAARAVMEKIVTHGEAILAQSRKGGNDGPSS